MRTLKLGNTIFNLDALKKMNKEQFEKEGHNCGMDVDKTWNRIQEELKSPVVETEEKTESTDVSKPVKTNKSNKKDRS